MAEKNIPLEVTLDTESDISKDVSNIVSAIADEEAVLPSPIDINVNNTEQLELPALEWQNYELLPVKIKLTNTGDTVILTAKYADDEHPSIKGGSLDGRYVFAQIHFHWGNTAAEGSLHTIDGAPLPLEMHVVHFNSQYEALDEALKHVGGVLCLVYFFALKSSPNTFLDPVLSNLKDVAFPDVVIKLTPFPVVNLFHIFTNDYFLYWGSTKSESRSHPMLWMISRTQECIDFHQLTQFRVLLDQRMRVISREQTPIADRENRHVFHVNPVTPCCNWTLSPLPHPKYRKDRWLVDRMDIDIGAPGGCREFIEALRREMQGRKSQCETTEE
ncbi:carbonic anhydrase 1-like [Topomyia yanbarensis]|uniref:carbonic anhydrase 1-like n=1 Tax=Topomyia yanbarensis TaxID=2498891 RepID=UPI00273BD3F5|nr:carbonic anhydrase 1-like [Topomyia yanbarensis]